MKQKISRRELETKLLAAIQAEPSCFGVEEISVTPVNVVGDRPTWHVNVISEGCVPFDLARKAAGRVRERMLAHYELDSRRSGYGPASQ